VELFGGVKYTRLHRHVPVILISPRPQPLDRVNEHFHLVRDMWSYLLRLLV
jgi:hypothetical protein